MFSGSLKTQAEALLARCRTHGLKLTTAESCTGGLISALLTEISGSSDVFEYGFVTYADKAKQQMIGVSAELLAAHGAVSEQVATAMAEGALRTSGADVALAVTGVAGPGGGSPQKPVGLVYIACARKGTQAIVERHAFTGTRDEVRLQAVTATITLALSPAIKL